MDLQMPGLDGIQAINAIRSGFPDAKIIVLTNTGDLRVVSALKASARGYVFKGFLSEKCNWS